MIRNLWDSGFPGTFSNMHSKVWHHRSYGWPLSIATSCKQCWSSVSFFRDRGIRREFHQYRLVLAQISSWRGSRSILWPAFQTINKIGDRVVGTDWRYLLSLQVTHKLLGLFVTHGGGAFVSQVGQKGFLTEDSFFRLAIMLWISL